MTVGATRAETREIGQAIYKKHGFPGSAGAGHYVGMSVHDVGDSSLPFQPAWSSRSSRSSRTPRSSCTCGSRTRCSSRQGPEILTPGVPKEVDEVLALVREALKRNR